MAWQYCTYWAREWEYLSPRLCQWWAFDIGMYNHGSPTLTRYLDFSHHTMTREQRQPCRPAPQPLRYRIITRSPRDSCGSLTCSVVSYLASVRGWGWWQCSLVLVLQLRLSRPQCYVTIHIGYKGLMKVGVLRVKAVLWVESYAGTSIKEFVDDMKR